MNVPCMIEITQSITFQERALAGREEVAAREARFAELVGRQARLVFRVAFSVLRNPQDSEDVVQETFLKLYRSGAWEGMRDERAFLSRTAWRMAVKKLPRLRNEPLGPDLSSSTDPNPEDAAIDADWHAAVHRLVDALPEELRQTLALSTVEELKSGEIARVMGIPETTVRTRLMRARNMLKRKLAELKGRPL